MLFGVVLYVYVDHVYLFAADKHTIVTDRTRYAMMRGPLAGFVAFAGFVTRPKNRTVGFAPAAYKADHDQVVCVCVLWYLWRKSVSVVE